MVAYTVVVGNTASICLNEIGKMFGKKGRPPEDRLARQREIYDAVAPLILRDGARQLSMHQAAHAACLSIGGLYHYFLTKRDLVLHGLCKEALLKQCRDFHAEFDHLMSLNPQRYIAEGINAAVREVMFCRPSIHAALELGVETFWEAIDMLLTSTSLEFEERLGQICPLVSEQELYQWGRAIRRSLCAALLDKSVTPNELRDELHILIGGYVERGRRTEQALALVPVSA